jgi:hypothetical protein
VVAKGKEKRRKRLQKVRSNTPHLVDHFPATRSLQRAIAIDRLATTSPSVAGDLTLGEDLLQI